MKIVLISVAVVLGLLYCCGAMIVKSETEQLEILKKIEVLAEDMEQKMIFLEGRIIDLEKEIGEREEEHGKEEIHSAEPEG